MERLAYYEKIINECIKQVFTELGYVPSTEYKYIKPDVAVQDLYVSMVDAMDSFEEDELLSNLPVCRCLIAEYIEKNTDFLNSKRERLNYLFTPERADEIYSKLYPIYGIYNEVVIPPELALFYVDKVLDFFKKIRFVSVSRNYFGLDAEHVRRLKEL